MPSEFRGHEQHGRQIAAVDAGSAYIAYLLEDGIIVHGRKEREASAQAGQYRIDSRRNKMMLKSDRLAAIGQDGGEKSHEDSVSCRVQHR
ncbi:hypothetical protein ACLBWT_21570 [Paenibacillus sp. D51F]